MRIQQEAILPLVAATKKCYGKEARIWLFGSRVDDAKRGGDIDLYIETTFPDGLVRATLDFRLALDPIFGEQKIDVVTRSTAKPVTPFQQLAKDSGIELTL